MSEVGDVQPIINLISSGGLVTTLILIIWAGATKKWVFGWVYQQEQQRAEEWRALALNGTKILGSAVHTLETTTKTKDLP